MLNILLPFLMMFSLSVFASPDFTDGLKSVDVVDITHQPMLVAQTVRPCTTSNESFDRMYIVTGAATQYAESETTGMSPLSLRPELNEVGWQGTQTI